jgi:hypothetical protein
VGALVIVDEGLEPWVAEAHRHHPMASVSLVLEAVLLLNVSTILEHHSTVFGSTTQVGETTMNNRDPLEFS